MIQITRHENKWRITIRDETLHFEKEKDFQDELKHLIKIKEKYEPNKNLGVSESKVRFKTSGSLK